MVCLYEKDFGKREKSEIIGSKNRAMKRRG
jgi:hypothetical protein